MTDVDVIQAHREGRIGGRWYPASRYEDRCAVCNRCGDRLSGGVFLINNVPLHRACAEEYFKACSDANE
jgi:hypothetical protein